MSVCLSLRLRQEKIGTFVKLQHISIILNILYILCDMYVVVEDYFAHVLSILVTIFRLLTKIHQNQFFIYFYGFKLLVL